MVTFHHFVTKGPKDSTLWYMLWKHNAKRSLRKADAIIAISDVAKKEILEHFGIDLKGKRVCVVGRSLVVGKPAAIMAIQRNGTVTVCHTKTKDMAAIAREADVIIAAAGKAGVVGEGFFKEGQVVIDVGINFDEEGNMKGDVDFAAAEPVVAAITPVPGGVGTVTTSVLVKHVIEAAKRTIK